MEYIAGAVLIILIFVTISYNAVNRLQASPAMNQAYHELAENPPPSHKLFTNSLSKEEIAKRLKKIAQSPPPKDLKMGAKCYDMAGPPARIDYVCPVCGGKTLYTIDSKDRNTSTFFLQYELPECRRLAKSIKVINIELDEHEFCKKCSPKTKKPLLTLIVKYPDKNTKVITRDVSIDDLQLIREFSEGSDRHEGEMGREIPLKQYLDRLYQLLGVSPDSK